MRPPRVHAVRRPAASSLVFRVALGFLAGMVVTAAVVRIFPSGEEIVTTTPVDAVAAVTAPEEKVEVAVKPSLKETPPAVTPPSRDRSSSASLPAISADPIADLRQRDLTLPVQGIKKGDIRDGFNEMRAGTRRHEAIDVLAPRHTPVLAVDDGTVARLFLSDAGGITIYQFDPSERYVYYYAHLENYAAGLKEGDLVKHGEVIGHVGTTGNAPRNTPHLHFAIFKMTDEKKWWQGTPIDPYAVLR